MTKPHSHKHLYLAITVAALGYFVDIYDLILFSIVRVTSLKSLMVNNDQLLDVGVKLINTQMLGMLAGGILWGILGDKKGRLSVLFGSIFLYSIANIANGFISDLQEYYFWRFIAGLGLAGELGAGITLVVELLPQSVRGWGTMVVASIGILGAVVAALVGDTFSWRTSYIVGGVMGLLLLILRINVHESGLFKHMASSQVKSGAFLSLFTDRKRFVKYLAVIFIGVPIWYTIGILITFSPEFGASFQLAPLPKSGMAVMLCYSGLAVGDFLSGWLSQILKSRKKVLFIFISGLLFSIVSYFLFARNSLFVYYASCFHMGFWAGYWAIFITVASEQFGTNIRATVTTTAPNFVRASVVPLTLLFQSIKEATSGDVATSALVVGSLALASSYVALYFLPETFHSDLSYFEKLD